MATTLRVYNDNNEKFDLDLFNEQQFLLDISAIESGEIGKVFGISSQQFSLPPTQNNQDYFGYLDNIGSTPSTSFVKKLPCQVLKDGGEVFSGFLYLENVVTNQDGDTIYNVVVVNELIDFKTAVENLTFGDLDWSEYNHNLTYTNISQSWDLNLFEGEVVYPLIDYGIKGQDISQVLIMNGGSLGTFTSPFTPLKVIDFKPAVRISTILNKIFDTVGYSYTSSFFESEYADTLYHVSTRDDNREVADIIPVSQSFKAYDTRNKTFYYGDLDVLLEFNTEIYDISNRWNTTTDKFTANTAGLYSFGGSLNFEVNSINTPSLTRGMRLKLFINGAAASIPNALFDLTGVQDGHSDTINFTFQNIQLSANDEVTLHLSWLSQDSNETMTLEGGLGNNYFECYASPSTAIGGNVNIGGVFNPKDKVLDFIQGLIEKFNLVIEPVNNQRKVFSVQTFNDWTSAGAIVDWTGKVDRSVKWEINHPVKSLPRTITFKDEEDKDAKNTYAINNTGRIFGSYTYEADSELAQGEREIGTYFAPTPMKYIEGTNNFIIPQLWALDNGTKKRIAFKPRILHYLGKKPNPMLTTRFFLTGQVTHTGVWFFEDESDVVHQMSYYPQFHHVSALPANNQARDLHFNAFQWWEYHQNYVNANTIRDAVYEYWGYYLNDVYDVDSRIVTLNITLKPTDIPTIKLNDKIFIDGHYYRINKISSANLTNESSVQVTLIKSPIRRFNFPRRRIKVSDIVNEYVDVVASPNDVNNLVDYVGYEDLTPVTSSAIINEAGNLDGFATLGGLVTYTPPETTIPSSNVVLGGANYIDDRSNNMTVVGGGNVVEDNVTNSIIYGNQNTIINGSKDVIIYGNNVSVGNVSVVSGTGSLEQVSSAFVISYSSQSISVPTGSNIIALNPNRDLTAEDMGKVVIANAQMEGSMRETYTSYTAQSGSLASPLYLTSSADITYHNHFEWTGGNGTQYVIIPSASLSENDGLKLKFTAGSGVGGTKIVDFIPADGTINGGAERAIVNAYGSLELQVVNNNYIILQENP